MECVFFINLRAIKVYKLSKIRKKKELYFKRDYNKNLFIKAKLS